MQNENNNLSFSNSSNKFQNDIHSSPKATALAEEDHRCTGLVRGIRRHSGSFMDEITSHQEGFVCSVRSQGMKQDWEIGIVGRCILTCQLIILTKQSGPKVEYFCLFIYVPIPRAVTPWTKFPEVFKWLVPHLLNCMLKAYLGNFLKNKDFWPPTSRLCRKPDENWGLIFHQDSQVTWFMGQYSE